MLITSTFNFKKNEKRYFCKAILGRFSKLLMIIDVVKIKNILLICLR